MNRFLLLFSCLIFSGVCKAQFAPAVGQPGTSAIYKDSSIFVAWANTCKISRGYQDITNPSLGYASVGDSSSAIGVAGSNGVVSLGDGGYALLTLDAPLTNGSGWDFAVFENAFNDSFLELAFVEVSSDGINYVRFPATSYTQDTLQISNAGGVDATKIDNLAGKYRALYGTPFDLEQLANQPLLNINAITHIKIIDVVGNINNAYASKDQYGNKINDPFSTPFPSSGFDLDAVGIIHNLTVGIIALSEMPVLNIFPNPAKGNASLQFYLPETISSSITLRNISGTTVFETQQTQPSGWQTVSLLTSHLPNGIYLLSISTEKGITTKKININND